MSRLRTEGLRYQNGGPIDLIIAPGECVCLSGPSGSGKTLLLRAIADLDPHEGHVLLDDVRGDEIDPPVWRRKVALLPAESQWWRDTVGDHFNHVQEAWLQRLDFPSDVLNWQVSRLSTGERQRLALVRLLSQEPQVLLLDEPTANLDAENIARAEALLEDYRKRHEAPVLWVSHDPEQIRRVGHRWVQMENGHLINEVRV